MSPPWVNSLRLWIFVPVLCAGWACYLVYGLNTLRKRRNYFLRVRFPSLALMDLSQSLFTLHAVCLHEIYLAQGRQLSCKMTNLATVLTPTNYLAIFLVRVLQLIVIFDPKFRARFYLVLPRFKMAIFLLTVVVAITFTLAMDLSPTPFCHTPSLCDMEGSCVWGASYYLVLILVGLFHLVLVPLLRHMMKLDIQERIGFTLEFKRILAMSVTLNTVIFATLALVDWGVLGTDWHMVTDVTLCVAFANNFYVGHVMPARKFGYAPPMPFSICRLRQQLRSWARKIWKLLHRGPKKPRKIAAEKPADPTPADPLRPAPPSPARRVAPSPLSRGLSDLHKSMHQVVQVLEKDETVTTTTPAVNSSDKWSDTETGGLNVEDLTLEEIFDHRELRQALITHCKNYLDEESVLYLLDTRDLRALDLAGTMGEPVTSKALSAIDRSRLAWVCERYLRVDGLYPLNLASPVQGVVYRLLKWEGTRRGTIADNKALLPDDVTTESVIRMLKQVGRDVERSVEDSLLPIFFRSDPAYATHSPAVLASSTPEQSKRRADVNCDRAARVASNRTAKGEKERKAKQSARGGLRNFGQQGDKDNQGEKDGQAGKAEGKGNNEQGGGGGEAQDLEKGQERGLV